MKVLQRIVAGLVFLVATAVLLLSLAGGVGVWLVKEPVTTRANRVFGRIETALDAAHQGLDQVQTSLAQAAVRLDRAREEQQNSPPQPNNRWKRAATRTALQAIAPDLGNAHQKLHTVAEAAVVVNSVLEDVGNFPFLSTAGVDLGPLMEINDSLAGVAPTAWRLSRLFGEPDPQSDEEAGTQLSRIEATLKTMKGLLAQYEPRLTQVRQRTDELKSRILLAITPAAVVVSLVCFWIALSQISLLAHACSWWRRSGQGPQPG